MPNTVFVEQFKSASIKRIAQFLKHNGEFLCPAIQDQPMMKNESRFKGMEVGDVLGLDTGHVMPKVQAGS